MDVTAARQSADLTLKVKIREIVKDQSGTGRRRVCNSAVIYLVTIDRKAVQGPIAVLYCFAITLTICPM